MSVPPHVPWLVHSGQFTTANGATVDIWEFNHTIEPDILSGWAKHFREHYCLDHQLDDGVAATGMSRADFLTTLKFPNGTRPPGPSTRAGDFAEILAADFVQYVMGYWCPRLRYLDRFNPDDSTKGCDVVAFLFEGDDHDPDDELFILEIKGALTGKPVNRLQDAINDSMKDKVREATTLNAMRQRLIDGGRREDANRVGRFQNETDRPFVRKNGAIAVLDNGAFDTTVLGLSDTTNHPNAKNLDLLVIKGDAMMALVHAIYDRAANEA
ncbi:DUF1837 domain-containing protein [Rhizobium ruizarguesonis]|uniref:DUF1837 domain-containing protein n=1 Tax=Rhizobium leguminosarum TaxID=384 RepID=UPI001C91F3D4|nr:DUF1837 domain-containing protein [Rhizobium leguminosarum]MBY3043191.1 DUF1837 domain-containing protein [Rhizobium leguminosarum]